MSKALLIGFGACSLFTLITFAWDKAAARRGSRRVPEARLLALTLLGGGAGALLGMIWLRHKTRKPRFWFAAWAGIALIVAVSLVAR